MIKIKLNKEKGKAMAKVVLSLIVFLSFWFTDFDIEYSGGWDMFMFDIIILGVLVISGHYFIKSMGEVFG